MSISESATRRRLVVAGDHRSVHVRGRCFRERRAANNPGGSAGLGERNPRRSRNAEWRELLAAEKDSAEDWRVLARRSGFPTPALELTTAADRRIWFDGYVRTYLERDLQDLAAISALPTAVA